MNVQWTDPPVVDDRRPVTTDGFGAVARFVIVAALIATIVFVTIVVQVTP